MRSPLRSSPSSRWRWSRRPAAQTFKIDPDLFGQKKAAPKPPEVDWNARRVG